MIRIGLVGSASERADAYARLLNVEQVTGDRARIMAIWSSGDADRTSAVARANRIPEVARSLHHLVDQVDAAIIVDRHGDLHAEHALPFLLDGKPVHVEPPLAVDPFDARRMVMAAAQSGAALTSFSPLSVPAVTESLREAVPAPIRLAQLAGPGDPGSAHGGLFSDAPHLLELTLALLGDRVTALRAARIGEIVTINAVWNPDAAAQIAIVRGLPSYSATLIGAAGSASRDIALDDRASVAALKHIVERFESGDSAVDRRRLVLPVAMVHAMIGSLDCGGEWVEVDETLGAMLRAGR